MQSFVIITEHADGMELSYDRPSVGIMMTKLSLVICY